MKVVAEEGGRGKIRMKRRQLVLKMEGRDHNQGMWTVSEC